MDDQPDESPVVIGIIDDGIAFAHRRFRTTGGGSRVEYFWLQDGVYQGKPVPFGDEHDKNDIDNLLTDSTHAGVVDEDELYRRAGLTDFRRPGHKSVAWRVSHGAHVMDQACGEEPAKAPANRPIVCVQLPIRVTADTSGAHLLPYVHLAMIYIVARAQSISARSCAGPWPVVVNLSYGIFAGPHDGTSPIEDMFEKVIALAEVVGVTLRIVLPAGNSYLSRTHAAAQKGLFVSRAGGKKTLSLNWRVPPDCRKPSFLELWLPYRASGAIGSRLSVTVTSPTGVAQNITEGGPTVNWLAANGATYAQMAWAFRPLPTGRSMFRVSLRGTTHLNPAPAGVWTVTLEDLALEAGDAVDLWVQRDDTLYGYPLRGRQSYFEVDNSHRDDEQDDPTYPIRLAGTINAIATGPSPIVMGGFIRREKMPADYTSSGPISPTQGMVSANNDGVTALAPSEDSPVLTGVLGAGSRSGSVVALNGTSVAAPRTARFIADELSAGRAGNRAAVRLKATFMGPPTARNGGGWIDASPVVPVRRS